MGSQKLTLSGQKMVDIIADLLYAGKNRRDIIQYLANEYKPASFSSSTIDKWIKKARPIVASRQKVDEEVKSEERDKGTREVAQRLNISKEAVLEGYAKIGFFDIRTIFDENDNLKSIAEIGVIAGGAIAGIEIEDRQEKSLGKDIDGNKIQGAVTRVYKIKLSDKRSALDSICKVMGYNAPLKVADTDKDGNDKPITRQVILVNGMEIEF